MSVTRIAAIAAFCALAAPPPPGAGQSPAPSAGTTPVAIRAPDTLAVRPPSPWAAAVPAPLADPDPPASFDLAVARGVRASGLRRSPVAHAAADVASFVAIPGSVLASGILYGAGELADRDDLGDLGLRSGQSIVVAGAVTAVGKMLVGRARPDASPDDPFDAALGRGFRGDRFQSFPSAHTAAAFASAASLTAELGGRNPGHRVWVIPLSYGVAALAGLSRIYQDHHWATDVAAGALIGTLSGWGVHELHQARRD